MKLAIGEELAAGRRPKVKVELATRPDEWDCYVDSIQSDNLYHRWVWRDVIEASFGHRAYYLAAIADGAICGVLPLVLVRSRLFGDSLVSLPFFSYGGVVADNGTARDALLSSAVELGRELKVRQIELRDSGVNDTTPLPAGWIEQSHKIVMEVGLPKTIDDYWQRLSPGRRKRLRYLLRRQLESEWGGIEAVPVFYEIFAANMRNLGTPVYPREFFEQQLRRLPDNIRILIIRDGSKPMAAGFVTAHRESLELPWAASLPESRKKEAPTVLYWSLIEHGIKEGFARVDLGRCSPAGGNYEFKRHWQPVERPLNWHYLQTSGAPIRMLNGDSPKFKLATAIWRRLPIAVANRLGPRLVRGIP
ncbi:MAG: FemAB family PEP-CTERM system-associated protein [Deltaproteobacteria bacterium]|nr:FemAB family PEP-CTERM system-associated protein [Deltaproteobacteria bacterium]